MATWFYRCCSCEYAKEVPSPTNDIKRLGGSPNRSDRGEKVAKHGFRKSAEKGGKKSSSELALAWSEEVGDSEANDASRMDSVDSPPPLPPPAEPPQVTEEAAAEEASGSEKAKRFARKGRRGSHLACRTEDETGASGPAEDTAEPLAEASASSPGKPSDQLLELARSTEGVLAGGAHEFAVFGIVQPEPGRSSSSRNKAVVETEFTEKVCTSSVSADKLPKALEQDGVAVLSWKGKKAEQPNQDNFFFCDTARFRFFGVADGHGQHGHWVSHWVARFVLRVLLADLEEAQSLPTNDGMARVFDQAHEAAKHAAKVECFDVWLSGTTLTVGVLDRVSRGGLLAWAGDSRGVVGRLGPKGEAKLAATTSDHKPQDPDEKRRIIQSGGEVVRLQNDMPHRVFARGKEAPGLAMSRALGDMMAHSVGIVHTPDVKRFTLEADQCLLCCSDGVWEFIKSAEALKMVHPMGRGKAAEAAEALVKESRDRWLREEVNLTDDITAIIVWGSQ